jgi:lipopolysaccharide/colanic/teichoic acid biosynthesis glycosyltransferase
VKEVKKVINGVLMEQIGLYGNYIKRVLDIILSFIAILFLSPLLLLTVVLVRIKLGSPVVFKQPRPGMGEKIFYLYKFRSMTNELGPDGRLLPDSQRLTKFGKFLRSSSIDELLELFNIVRGDMSIVGPRPLSIYYLPHYPEKYRRRHEVRPGLTGLAQINGRNNLPWDDRFAFDIDYVDHVSFSNDVRIIVGTFFKVLKRADISVRGTTKVKDYGPYRILQEEGEPMKKANAAMTYSEIGSYFWLDGKETVNGNAEETLAFLPAVTDSSFTFSGRNAIDIALHDILKNQNIKKAYVPSYSCISMLQAFIDREIPFEFYDVKYAEGNFVYDIPAVEKGDVVLIMSYFGLDTEKAYALITALHKQGAVVIEDITHSLLREKNACDDSDYMVASLRKWFAVPTGGWIGKTKGNLCDKPYIDSNQAVKEKISGMKEKYEYLTGRTASKENFLLTQAKFDNDLIHVDRMLKIDDLSLSILNNTDSKKVINQRRLNAKALLNGLADLNGKICDIPKIDLNFDVPLFVPVFLDTEKRDSLRTYLINKGVYCPVHWSEVAGAPSEIKERELSLICDQRYSEADMNEIVNCIHSWAKTIQN